MIQIDLETDDDEDVATLAEIAERSVELIRTCVVHSNKLGGRTTAGQKGLIHLMVAGLIEVEGAADAPVTPHFLKPSLYVPNPFIMAAARANCMK